MKLEMPVTILSENEYGDIGTEEHENIDLEELKDRIDVLSNKGWEVIEIQHGESQATFIF